MSSLPTELREAAVKLRSADIGGSEELEDIAYAVSDLLDREADLQTTMSTLMEAGYNPEILLDASSQSRVLARAINRSTL